MVTLYMWIVYVAVVKAQHAYISTFSESKTWQYSDSHCTLAEPTLTYTRDGIQAAVDIAGLQPGDKAWLGYVKSYKIFQYTGCVQLKKIKPQLTLHSFMPSGPGGCFSACKSEYFGIEKSHHKTSASCYCFGNTVENESLKDLRSTMCNNKCEQPDETWCGADGYLSVYEEVLHTGLENMENIPMSQQICGAYNIENSKWIWKRCSLSSKFICDTEYLKANTELNVNADYANNWLQASFRCFINHKYPAKFRAKFDKIRNSSSTNNTDDVWTGIMRSYVVEKKKETSTPALFGYLEVVEDGRYDVKFTNGVYSLGKALCINDSIPNNLPYTGSTHNVRMKAPYAKICVNNDEICVYEIPDANVYYDYCVAMDIDVMRVANQDGPYMELTSPRRIDENEYDSCNDIQDETVAGKATDASTSEYRKIALTCNTSTQTDNMYAKSNVDYERTDKSIGGVHV